MDRPSRQSLEDRCRTIELLALDVDGVLTDGGIILDDHGVESKQFHVRDGLAFAIWHQTGKRSAILSGRKSEVVGRRAAELNIGFIRQGLNDKAEAFRELLRQEKLRVDQVCFVGDDLVDLPVLLASGLAVCPNDAVVEVRGAVHYIADRSGGGGVIREVVELILKAQGKWDDLATLYRVPAV
jgi:3-deoxy-D-manno-octulosonate 8-phosphate phosphatase (KDO 8-P phosphatase)